MAIIGEPTFQKVALAYSTPLYYVGEDPVHPSMSGFARPFIQYPLHVASQFDSSQFSHPVAIYPVVVPPLNFSGGNRGPFAVNPVASHFNNQGQPVPIRFESQGSGFWRFIDRYLEFFRRHRIPIFPQLASWLSARAALNRAPVQDLYEQQFENFPTSFSTGSRFGELEWQVGGLEPQSPFFPYRRLVHSPRVHYGITGLGSHVLGTVAQVTGFGEPVGLMGTLFSSWVPDGAIEFGATSRYHPIVLGGTSQPHEVLEYLSCTPNALFSERHRTSRSFSGVSLQNNLQNSIISPVDISDREKKAKVVSAEFLVDTVLAQVQSRLEGRIQGEDWTRIQQEVRTSSLQALNFNNQPIDQTMKPVEEASKLLGVSERQLRRIATDPSVQAVHRFEWITMPTERLYLNPEHVIRYRQEHPMGRPKSEKESRR